MKNKLLLFALALFVCASTSAQAGEVAVACAANFTSPMKELAAIYEQRTGVVVIPTFGSTGMLYGQIDQSAPYDLFFAADTARPEKLVAGGKATRNETYAKGKVVLWSTSPALAKASDWQAAVQEASVQKIGLASPKTAPYGAAAMAAMDQTGVLPAVESNLVFGKNVGQAFEYAWSGATDASFVALSQALSEKGVTGRYWLVSEAALITQNACVLSGAGDLALAFFDFVLGDAAAREIINLYGYK